MAVQYMHDSAESIARLESISIGPPAPFFVHTEEQIRMRTCEIQGEVNKIKVLREYQKEAVQVCLVSTLSDVGFMCRLQYARYCK